MDENKNKNNLEVTETAEENVNKAEKQQNEENFFKKTWNKVLKIFKKDESRDEHYISAKEARRISKENLRITLEFEKKKRRKNVPESEYITTMKDPGNVVEFDDLHTYFFTDVGVVKAVDGVSFEIPKGKIVGVVGESGCGKSVTSLSLMQLVQAPQGQIVSGAIRFEGTDYSYDENRDKIPIYKLDENGNRVLDEKGKPVIETNEFGVPQYKTERKVFDIAKMPKSEMHRIRGNLVSMIFQEPMTSLNPVFTIGNQLDEVTLLHIEGATKEYAKKRSIEMLELVGIAMPENIYKRYPHELSGGMRQRVMIAMALICNPELIIADEPTTALDVTIQAQILDLLREIKNKINGSIMLITHDLGVIAEMADYVVVMYAGKVIERGTALEIFQNPLHPYTMGLQKSKPAVNKKVDRLYNIPGQVPNPINMPSYCYFKDRCDKCISKCNGVYPPMIQVTPTHSVSCYLYNEMMEGK